MIIYSLTVLESIINRTNHTKLRFHDGVPFYDTDQEGAIRFLREKLTSETPVHYVTLTVGMYLEALKDKLFLDVLNNASPFPESTGLQEYSKFHPPVMPKIPGGDTIRKLVEELVELKKPLVLIGTSEENRKRAAAVLDYEVKGLEVIVIDGEHNFDDPKESFEIVRRLEEIQPGLTVVASDEIRGPKWIHDYLIKPNRGSGVIVSGGQTIDVWACVKKSPPQWAREHGLGWFFRMFLENENRRNRYIELLKDFLFLSSSNVLKKPRIVSPTSEFGD